jgi:hypothetical protein
MKQFILIISLLITGSVFTADFRGNTKDNPKAKLFDAAKTGNLLIIAELIKRGVDINAADNKGKTASFLLRFSVKKRDEMKRSLLISTLSKNPGEV